MFIRLIRNDGIQHDIGSDLSSGAKGGLVNSSVAVLVGKSGVSSGKQQVLNKTVEATIKIAETIWGIDE